MKYGESREIVIIADHRIPPGWCVGVSDDAIKVIDHHGNDVTAMVTGHKNAPVREGESMAAPDFMIDEHAIASQIQGMVMNHVKRRMNETSLDVIKAADQLRDARLTVMHLEKVFDEKRKDADVWRRALTMLEAEHHAGEHQADGASPERNPPVDGRW